MQDEQRQLFTIMLIVFIGFIGASIAYPIFPPLFLSPTPHAIIPQSWSIATRSFYLGLALAAYPLGQFLGSPIIGGCSDRYGRKTLLMISLIFSAAGYLLTALALELHMLWLLLFSRFATGLMEGNIAIVRAMAADLQSISKYKSFGRIGSSAAIGYTMGPLIGGFLSDNTLVSWFSFAFPFYLAAGFVAITIYLTAYKIKETHVHDHQVIVSIWQRFNLIKRFHLLFKSSETLKYLLIVSSIFTLAVDIYYEFGPVYLTGLWAMTPAGIGVYNSILSITLALGSGWLPHFLSQYYSVQRIVTISILITGLLLLLMVISPTKISAFILFGLIGFAIATANTNVTIQISNAAEKRMQGEALGAQLSLRMLGDTIICLTGGFLIMASFLLPILFSAGIAVLAGILYWRKFAFIKE